MSRPLNPNTPSLTVRVLVQVVELVLVFGNGYTNSNRRNRRSKAVNITYTPPCKAAPILLVLVQELLVVLGNVYPTNSHGSIRSSRISEAINIT